MREREREREKEREREGRERFRKMSFSPRCWKELIIRAMERIEIVISTSVKDGEGEKRKQQVEENYMHIGIFTYTQRAYG